MAEINTPKTSEVNQVPPQENKSITLKIPKLNVQVVVLGLVAFITLFQTVQLFRISNSSASTSVRAAPATTTHSGGSGTGSNASTPQSMVGGC